MKVDIISKLQTEKLVKKIIDEKFLRIEKKINSLFKEQKKLKEQLLILKYAKRGITLGN